MSKITDDELDSKVEVAKLLNILERECKGNGTGAIARLVRIYGWTFEFRIDDNGILLAVAGRPLP